MTFTLHPGARAELIEAGEFYEDCSLGLGGEFLDEVQEAIARILAHPEAWSRTSGRSRRCLTRRFPYSVIYQVKPDRIRILAVAHAQRRPGYWLDRVQDDESADAETLS